MKIRLKWIIQIFLLIGALSTFSLPSNAAQPNLGLALDVLPSTDPEISKLTQGQALWFVIPPGSSKFRDVRITSSANVSERIDLSIGYLNRIDGVATLDDSKKSETAPWANFNPKSFVLKPGESQIVRFNYVIPDDVEVGIHEAFLFATASQLVVKNSSEYRVPQNARVASPIFLGVGTSADIATDFSIDDVSGVVVDGVNQLKIDFNNIGKTPLSLSGSIQLSSAEFQNLLIGPLQFTSLVIRPGIKSYVLVPAPPELTPGKWKILVSATQISTTKTREFTKNLTFEPPSALISNLVRVLSALLFFGLFVLAYRTLRKSRVKTDNYPDEVPSFGGSRLKKKGEVKKRGKSSEELEIDRLIDEIMQRRTKPSFTKTSSGKKQVARKPAAKKKAPVKKAAASSKPGVRKAVKKKPIKKAAPSKVKRSKN